MFCYRLNGFSLIIEFFSEAFGAEKNNFDLSWRNGNALLAEARKSMHLPRNTQKSTLVDREPGMNEQFQDEKQAGAGHPAESKKFKAHEFGNRPNLFENDQSCLGNKTTQSEEANKKKALHSRYSKGKDAVQFDDDDDDIIEVVPTGAEHGKIIHMSPKK